jgi:hypothetical protein
MRPLRLRRVLGDHFRFLLVDVVLSGFTLVAFGSMALLHHAGAGGW